MISKNSFFDFSLIREILRRQLWTITLSSIALFFTLPLPIVMVIQNSRSKSRTAYPNADQLREDTVKTVHTMLSMNNVFLKLVLISLAVITGITIFSHLHSREKTDFFHALPVSRGKLFTTRFTAGIIAVLPAYLINLLLSVSFAAAFGFGEAFSAIELFQAIGVHLTFFLVIYATSILCAILCGNTIVSLLLFAWVSFSPSLCVIWLGALEQMFYKTSVGTSELMDQLMIRLSPIVQYLASDSDSYNNYLFSRVSMLGSNNLWMWLALYLLVFALVTALALLLNTKRKSEAAGSAIAFEKLKTPLKFYMVTIIAVGAGLFLGSVVNHLWMYIGFFLGGILCHWLVEIVYHFDFKAIFKNMRWFAVYSVIFALFITGMYFDVTGFDKYQPKPESLSGVDITMYNYLQDFGEKNNAPLTDPDNIARVCALAKIGVDQRNETYPDDTTDEVQYFTVKFNRKIGGQVQRSYHIVVNAEIHQLIDELRYSKEFKLKRQPLFALDKSKVAVMSFQGPKNMNYDERPTAISDKSQISEILTTAREEWQKISPKYLADTAPISIMSISKNSDEFDFKHNYYGDYEIPLYPCFTKTLALIKSYSGFQPEPITIDDVTSIHVSADLDTDSTKEMTKDGVNEEKIVTNPLDMAVLLQKAVSSDLAGNADPNFKLEPGIQLRVKLKKSLSDTYMSFPKGDVPTEVLEQYK